MSYLSHLEDVICQYKERIYDLSWIMLFVWFDNQILDFLTFSAELLTAKIDKYYQLNVETAKVYDFQNKILQVYFEQRKSNLK